MSPQVVYWDLLGHMKQKFAYLSPNFTKLNDSFTKELQIVSPTKSQLMTTVLHRYPHPLASGCLVTCTMVIMTLGCYSNHPRKIVTGKTLCGRQCSLQPWCFWIDYYYVTDYYLLKGYVPVAHCCATMLIRYVAFLAWCSYQWYDSLVSYIAHYTVPLAT